MRIVNDKGMNEIKAFLGKYHNLGIDHFTQDMLNGWAQDAEERGHIELKSWESWRGRVELLDLPDDCFDTIPDNDF